MDPSMDIHPCEGIAGAGAGAASKTDWITKLRNSQEDAYIHADIHPYTHTYNTLYINTQIHPYIHTCIHTYIDPYIHTSIHNCIHTYSNQGPFVPKKNSQ
jgi:hypothetical protein